MTAIGRRLRRLEAHSGLTETTAEREARARLLERLEAGRRRLAELRGESVPARVRPPDGHCPGDPKLRPFAVDATVEALYAGRERVRVARDELAGQIPDAHSGNSALGEEHLEKCHTRAFPPIRPSSVVKSATLTR
jgi:hypothetical protein